jgi:hypothetical protein
MSDQRKTLLGLAHKAAKQLAWDEDFRREQQQAITGKYSCKDMSDAQLRRWLYHLKKLGANIFVPSPDTTGGDADRPTANQLAEIEKLSAEKGFNAGLDDPGLIKFIHHTARVSHPRFLTRKQASQVITGLRNWTGNKSQGSRA